MVREAVRGDDDDASDNVAVGAVDRVDNTLADTVATAQVSKRGSVVSRTRTAGCCVPSCPRLSEDPLSSCSKPSC